MQSQKRLLRVLNLAAALVFAGGITYVCAVGAGPLPPLGPAFNPATGVWTMAADAVQPKSQVIRIPGLQQPVQVSFDAQGAAYIHAKTDHDLFLATGYVHAKYRLFQMDLMRRQGEGHLSQVVGSKAFASDTFEDQLGLERTAQAEWKQMSNGDPARAALLAYAQGVNDVIRADENSGDLPVLFKLLGYSPQLWSPIDTLVVQGDMTQTLDFSTGPLEEALLVHSLGYHKTMDYFPVLPVDKQEPYDPGPYTKDALAPIETHESVNQAETTAIQTVLTTFSSLPATALHHGSNSNNWAVDGTKTASGAAMLAGDTWI